MKCPHCGEPLPAGRAKCRRCGYEVKDVALTGEQEQEQGKDEPATTREVSPDEVHVSRSGGGSLFDDLFGGGIFGGLFGNLFGGIFGSDEDRGYEADPRYYDDFGNEIDLPDEFERESVLIEDVEVYEESEEKSDKSGRKKDPSET